MLSLQNCRYFWLYMLAKIINEHWREIVWETRGTRVPIPYWNRIIVNMVIIIIIFSTSVSYMCITRTRIYIYAFIFLCGVRNDIIVNILLVNGGMAVARESLKLYASNVHDRNSVKTVKKTKNRTIYITDFHRSNATVSIREPLYDKNVRFIFNLVYVIAQKEKISFVLI